MSYVATLIVGDTCVLLLNVELPQLSDKPLGDFGAVGGDIHVPSRVIPVIVEFHLHGLPPHAMSRFGLLAICRLPEFYDIALHTVLPRPGADRRFFFQRARGHDTTI